MQYQAQRSGTVATAGPYRFVRHPQYDAFALIMSGFRLQWPTVITVAMFPILLTAYVRLARAEERDSLARFGEAYREYRVRTPAFLPAIRGFRSAAPSRAR